MNQIKHNRGSTENRRFCTLTVPFNHCEMQCLSKIKSRFQEFISYKLYKIETHSLHDWIQ